MMAPRDWGAFPLIKAPNTPRLAPIAVIGLYNSGSTAIAGLLHRLGVDMGAPFWKVSDDGSRANYYEPWDLSARLREWWNEPEIQERVDRQTRLAYLTDWRLGRASDHSGPTGAKHPLLSLCGGEILEAWGASTRLLRAWRPLEESVERLKARRWFPGHEDPLQQRLWEASEELCAQRPHLRIDYHRLKHDPNAVVREIVAHTALEPTPAGLASAVAFIDRGAG
ncbi:MAG TPA: hypothetical protein VFT74_11445 [Isosphaeraceae bacterium]|nr:hypothetical protein [Isosphaeraceae bacterium]